MECKISKSTEAELTLCTVKILSHTRGRFLASYDQHYGTIYKPLKFLVFNVMEFFMFRKKAKNQLSQNLITSKAFEPHENNPQLQKWGNKR